MVRLWNTAHVGARGRLERRVPFLPILQIERLQQRRLRAMVAHASRTVPFYRQAMQRAHITSSDIRPADDLSLLPLVDGALVYRQTEGFLSANGRPQGAYTLFSTGASTTGPKSTVWDRRALFRQLAYGERDRIVLSHLLGKTWGQRRLSLFPQESSTAEVTRFHRARLFLPPGSARTESMSSQASYEEIAQRISELRPDVAYSDGSVADGFFRLCSCPQPSARSAACLGLWGRLPLLGGVAR
jgi:hypothetical protein